MKVLFATSESYPYAASGGLGDVAFALPKALKKKNVACRVVMPLYSKIPWELRKDMKFIKAISVPVAWRSQYCGIFDCYAGWLFSGRYDAFGSSYRSILRRGI